MKTQKTIEIKQRIDILLHEYSRASENIYINEFELSGNSEVLNIEQMAVIMGVQNKIHRNTQEYIKREILKLTK